MQPIEAGADIAKAMLRGKYKVLNAHFRKENNISDYLSSHLKNLKPHKTLQEIYPKQGGGRE